MRLRTAFQRVDFDVHLAGVMPQGLRFSVANAGRPRQRLFAAVDFGTLHGIRPMMHASAPESMIFIDGVEDVALNEEMLDRVRTGARDDAFHRAITDAQVGRRRAVRIVALRNKVDRWNRLVRREKVDPGMKIWKLVGRPRRSHCNRARRVEAEEPDSRIAAAEL